MTIDRSGKYSIKRVPERVVEFTEDFLKNLPDPVSYTDVYWDTECPRLTVLKAKRGVLFRVRLIASERRAIGITTKSHLQFLGYDMTVEQARTKYREWMQAAHEGRRLFHGEDHKVKELMADNPVTSERGYEALMSVMMDAYAQAANGKGEERHGVGQPFEEQDMQRIIRATSIDFAIGQAMKKMLEARRMPNLKQQRHELLGAVVYAAGAVCALDHASSSTEDDADDKQEEAA